VPAALTLNASEAASPGSHPEPTGSTPRCCTGSERADSHRPGGLGDQGIRALVWTVSGDEMTARWLAAPAAEA